MPVNCSSRSHQQPAFKLASDKNSEESRSLRVIQAKIYFVQRLQPNELFSRCKITAVPMVSIQEWLLNRANNELFSFDMADFNQEINEILEGHSESDVSITDDDYRKYCWELFQAWQRDIEYLSSLNLPRIIASHIRNRCKKVNTSARLESWVELGSESARLDGPQLASDIENAIRAAWKVKVPWRADAVSKISEELSLETLHKFHLGLENLIGYPPTNAEFLDLMKREHEHSQPFPDLKGRYIDPKVEWNIVMRSKKWNITGAECKPTIEIERRDIGKPLDHYFQIAKEKFSKAQASGAKIDSLIEAEVAALRLWTGPMHKKYAEMLRNPVTPSGPYVTTLHAINSGITKLARIRRLTAKRKVYRGYRNLSVKELKKDAFQCVGGVEKCVLATSEDLDVAVQYSGPDAFILEMEVGQVNRGADVSWLSQFPFEKEILFNALSNIEFVRSPQLRFVEGRGTVLVYQVCVSANVKSKTLEEFVRLRKDLHLNLVEVLTQEARQMIYIRERDSRYELIKSLGAECRSRCDYICRQAENADVSIFNEGVPEYVCLVEDAIMLQSRALKIIDLALQWFQSGEIDLADRDLDGFQDWQLEALRTAFRSGELSHVKTILLEQVRLRLQTGCFFTAESLNLGAVYKLETVCRAAKLLTLNPLLNDLKMKSTSATAEVWEQVFKQLCPGRPKLRVNDFFLAEYSIVTLQQLELRNLDIGMAVMVAPALVSHASSALTSLSLWGSHIGCAGAESLGRAFSVLHRLRYVDLRSCCIADRGCTGIAHSLPALTELEDLNLAHNEVNDDGFNFLSAAICEHGLSRLKPVDMRYNSTQLPCRRCDRRCIIRNHVLFKFETSARMTCVSWSPQGEQLAGGSRDYTIIIRDSNTGDKVSTLKGHSNTVQSVAWAPRGDKIASGSKDWTTIIWDAQTGDQMLKLKGHTSEVTSVSWRPEGDQIASGSLDDTIIIWDAKTGAQISTLMGHASTVYSVAWSPWGDQIVSGGCGIGKAENSCDNPGEVILWNAKTGHQIVVLKGHTKAVYNVRWSPGGDQIASGSDDQTIIIWDAKTGVQKSKLVGHSHHVTGIAWHPRGLQIASASYDKTIIIWDTKSGQKNSTIECHTDVIMSVAWHPSGNQIASGSYDNTIIIRDAKESEEISTLKGHTDWVQSVAWSPGGDKFASGSFDSTVIIWDGQTGDRVSLKGHSGSVLSVAWSPRGDKITSGSQDRTIIIWNVQSKDKSSTLKGHTASVNSVVWSPKYDQIASGSDDKTIIIWDPNTGQQVSTLKGHASPVKTLVWSPGDDHIVSGGSVSASAPRKGKKHQLSGEIMVWNAKTGNQISTIKGHTSTVNCVATSPGGGLIASASNDKTVIIWDAKTEALVLVLMGHTKAVSSVAWSPVGDLIASGSQDHTIIIWNAKLGDQVSKFGDQVSKFKGHSCKVCIVAWSPKGDQIASGSEDHTIIIWDAKTGKQASHARATPSLKPHFPSDSDMALDFLCTSVCSVNSHELYLSVCDCASDSISIICLVSMLLNCADLHSTAGGAGGDGDLSEDLRRSPILRLKKGRTTLQSPLSVRFYFQSTHKSHNETRNSQHT